MEIPTGSIVEVRTNAKEKIRGRIGEATEQNFVVQRVKNEKVESLNLSYQDVKNIKIAAGAQGTGSKVGRTVAYVVLGGLATLGIIVLIAVAAWGSGG